MSGDIVVALRDQARRRCPPGFPQHRMTEWLAADEIERLRGALAPRKHVESPSPYDLSQGRKGARGLKP